MKALIAVGVGTVIVLAGTYVLFHYALVGPSGGKGTSPVESANGVPGMPAAAPAPVALPKEFRLTIAEARPGQDGTIVRAQQGETIALVVASDRAGQLEIHGYGKAVSVGAHGEVKLSIDAKHTGRFPIHLHSA